MIVSGTEIVLLFLYKVWKNADFMDNTEPEKNNFAVLKKQRKTTVIKDKSSMYSKVIVYAGKNKAYKD